jgi:hypothetical protein
MPIENESEEFKRGYAVGYDAACAAFNIRRNRLEVTKEWALEARVESAEFADEDAFQRGYGAGWAGQSNADDNADYVAGYECGQDDSKEANAESRKEYGAEAA